MRAIRRAAVGALLVVAGCSAPAPAPVAPSGTAAPAASADDQLCGRSAQLVSGVRDAARTLDLGPVLPPAISLLFLADRQDAAQDGLAEPAVRAASTELVAAIDDLSTQAEAGRPTASATADLGTPIQFDTTRVVAAATGLERACAARS